MKRKYNKTKKINKKLFLGETQLLSCFEMDPKDIEKLAKILRDQGDKLLTSEFKFTLTGWSPVFLS